MNRRRSLTLMAAAAAYAQLVRCGMGADRSFPIKVNGASAERGHLLRTAEMAVPDRTMDVPVLIVGAGVAGLSAARALAQRGMTDFLVPLDAERTLLQARRELADSSSRLALNLVAVSKALAASPAPSKAG